MKTNTKLQCIQQLIRDTRDSQKEISCKKNNQKNQPCICNEFDLIIDELGTLKNKFKQEKNLIIKNPMHLLAWGYLENMFDSYHTLIGECELKKECIGDWIRSWANGGGMESIKYVIAEANYKAITVSEFLDAIKEDEYCEYGTAILFADIINCILEDEYKEEINRTIPT